MKHAHLYTPMFDQVIMLFFTSVSTVLGSLGLPNWIPVMMGSASVFGAISAYLDLGEQLRRTNQALVSIRKLMVWWHGLSVIEKRIPANASKLVVSMETIIQAEVGCVYVKAQSSDSDAAGEDGNNKKG